MIQCNLTYGQKCLISTRDFPSHRHVNSKSSMKLLGWTAYDIGFMTSVIKWRRLHLQKVCCFCVMARASAKHQIHRQTSVYPLSQSRHVSQIIRRQTFNLINKINFYGSFYCIVCLKLPFPHLTISQIESADNFQHKSIGHQGKYPLGRNNFAILRNLFWCDASSIINTLCWSEKKENMTPEQNTPVETKLTTSGLTKRADTFLCVGKTIQNHLASFRIEMINEIDSHNLASHDVIKLRDLRYTLLI